MLEKLNRYVTRVGVFLITAALIAGMAGCDGCGYSLPPSQNLEIRTWYDLDDVRDNLEGHHSLMNDLDSTTAGYAELASPTANQGKGWEPIGIYHPHGPTAFTGFMGTFDGQGYEIRDLFINRPDEDSVGLFKYVDDGVIKDIGVTNVTVIGEDSVGALAGSIYDMVIYGDDAVAVSNYHSSGSVTGNDGVGGLAGYGNAVFIDSYFTGSVTGYESVGGLVGSNFGTVSNSHFTGNVAGTWSVGGLVGENWDGTVNNSYSSGSVSGYDHIGGLVGSAFSGAVIDSYSTASVTGDEGVGGLVGVNSATVSNSYYDYDEVLVNGEHIITIGALSVEDFDQWLANDKSLDINERLSQENGCYLINDVNDFKQLLAFGQNANLKFRLTGDLNLTTEPGLYIPYLAGKFDGNGHKILNLNFNSGSVHYVGLFGYIAPGAAVTQVGADNINISGASSIGGLVGRSCGTVSGSYSTGTVTGSDNIGGLVGANWGTVTNSHSSASVSGGDAVGGLVGSNYESSVDNSYSTGSVTGDEHVGGLVGINYGTVSNSYSSNSVTGNYAVGGLVGANDKATVSNSYYDYGEVSISGEKVITIGALFSEDFEQWLDNDRFLNVNVRLSQEDGYYLINDVDDLKQLLPFGQNASLKFTLTNDMDLAAEPNFYIPYLAGEFDGNGHKISNLSFNFGFVSYIGLFGYIAPGGNVTQVGIENVDVTGDHHVGGLAGLNAGDVSNSYSTGSVSGDENIGGLVGYNLGTVSNSHSTAKVSGDEDVGGLVGDIDSSWSCCGIVSNCYSAGSVTGDENVGGLVGHTRYSTDVVSNSFWDRQTSKLYISDGGTRKNTAQMKNIATFSGAGWNITAVANPGTRNPYYIWNIVDDMTYPFLSWQLV
jgi:hypothetical protein